MRDLYVFRSHRDANSDFPRPARGDDVVVLTVAEIENGILGLELRNVYLFWPLEMRPLFEVMHRMRDRDGQLYMPGFVPLDARLRMQPPVGEPMTATEIEARWAAMEFRLPRETSPPANVRKGPETTGD